MIKPRVLTVHQPYATLLVKRFKVHETRGYPTPSAFRGPLVIHAGKNRESLDEALQSMIAAKQRGVPLHPGSFLWHFSAILREMNLKIVKDILEAFPCGVALGVAEKVTCLPADKILDLTEREAALGNFEDWDERRYGWRLDGVREFKRPYPLRGQQGLFPWPEGVPLPE